MRGFSTENFKLRIRDLVYQKRKSEELNNGVEKIRIKTLKI